MPAKPVPGRSRIDYKGDQAFIDLVKEAAAQARMPLSVYITQALAERLKRDGFEIPAPGQEQPKRPRGRPSGTRKVKE